MTFLFFVVKLFLSEAPFVFVSRTPFLLIYVNRTGGLTYESLKQIQILASEAEDEDGETHVCCVAILQVIQSDLSSPYLEVI